MLEAWGEVFEKKGIELVLSMTMSNGSRTITIRKSLILLESIN